MRQNRKVHACSCCFRIKGREDDQYVNLSDGQKLCSDCYSSIAITDINKCNPLIKKVREFYKMLRFKVNEDIPILLVDEKEMNRGCVKSKKGNYVTHGKTLLGRGTRDVTRIEKCTKNGENIEMERSTIATSGITILLLFGLSDVFMGGVLAHEMMHAYLAEIKGCRTMTKRVEEGICEVMRYKWMKWFCSKIGDHSSFIDRVRKGLKNYYVEWMETSKDKIYGQGFKEVKQAIDQLNLKDILYHIVSKGRLPPNLNPKPNQNRPKAKGNAKRGRLERDRRRRRRPIDRIGHRRSI